MKFDLEERSLNFSKNCIDLCKKFKKDVINIELIKQLIRAACSIGANYREANDTITRKDFGHRIGICRRESKECGYWLELVSHANSEFASEIILLKDEALQFTRIFSTINKNLKSNDK